MKAEDWTLLDRQALGAVRLSLAKNVAYNFFNEKTTYDLFKALSNMYKKSSVLMSVDIKFDDEVQALFLLSLFPESLSSTVTAVSGSTESTKLKLDNIRDLIPGKDIQRVLELFVKCRRQRQGQKARQRVETEQRDKKVNMATRDYDDALVCYVENTIDDRIMDSGVRDVVLKTSFGTSWTLKDVSLVVARGNECESIYMVEVPFNGINATIDSRGNTALWHQRLRHMSEKEEDPVTMLPLSMTTTGSREHNEYCAENEIRMLKIVSETPQRNDVAERMNRTLNERAKSIRLHAGLPNIFWKDSVTTAAYLINRGPSVPLGFRIPYEEWQGKEVSLAHLRIFVCDSYVKVKDVARDKLDAKSVKCTFIGYGSDEMAYRFWGSKGHTVVRSKDVTFNEGSLYRAKAAINSSNLTKLNQKDQVVLKDSLENLTNKSIVAEHGLSSEITQSPGESSDTSEGSENNRNFEDSRRSNEEDSGDRASSEEEGSETPQVRRSTRESKAPVRYSLSGNYLLLKENGDPKSYSEALNGKESVQWKKAINEEISSLEKNQTWSLVKLPAGKKALQNKWKRGVDYNEIFSPVMKMTTIRLVLSIVVAEDLHLEQLDVKTAFLHDDLNEDICMTQPEGSHMAEIKKLKRQLSQEFEVKDLGFAKQILDMSIIKDKTKGTLRLSQKKYIGKVLEKFNMKDAEARCQSLEDHFKLIGSVMYAMVCTRPDIAHVVRVVSKFMSNLEREHWEAVKWLLHYLKGTSKATLYFSRKEAFLEGFSNSDYGGCLNSGKSTTCDVFTVGGITVSWMSIIQKCVAMSTTKAEYMAIAEAGKELVWLKNFLEELDKAQTEDVIFEEGYWSKEPCIYVHQGGDSRKVEALRNFNWPPR
ncbi:retrovirus-related pol polyprotein from transposon TNT 1-94 [Tanacetum coccineum]